MHCVPLWPLTPKKPTGRIIDSFVEAVPLHLREANEFVAQHHRHSLPTVGGRFVSRRLDDGKTLEVLRVATDGTANACSFLYSRCAKIARLLGYERVIPYTLASEGGASLGAVGAKPTGPLESHDVGQPGQAPQEPVRLSRAEIPLGMVSHDPR